MFATLAGNANAGGSLSISVSPLDAHQARALQAGFGVYSIVRGMRNSGLIRQCGSGNVAGIGQNGFGNNGVIQHRGRGHFATQPHQAKVIHAAAALLEA